MRINENELRVAVDVDKTLITTYDPKVHKPKEAIEMDYYGTTVFKVKMYRNIALLVAQKARGYEVVVHSANGFAWAQEVITKLDLEKHVDECATKFLKYIDDMPADEWMSRIFIPENE